MSKANIRAIELFFMNGTKIRIEDDEYVVRKLARKIRKNTEEILWVRSHLTGCEYAVRRDFVAFVAVVDMDFSIETGGMVDGDDSDDAPDSVWGE